MYKFQVLKIKKIKHLKTEIFNFKKSKKRRNLIKYVLLILKIKIRAKK